MAHNLWTLAVRQIYGWDGIPKVFAEDFILSSVNRANAIAIRVHEDAACRECHS